MISELGDLAKLLEMSAEVARRIADVRKSSREKIYDLADQIDEVAEILHDIVKFDGGDGKAPLNRK